MRPAVSKCSLWATLPGDGVKVRYIRMELDGEDGEGKGSKEEEGGNVAGGTTFLCIPGNPGNDRFYVKFGEHLLYSYFARTGRPARFYSIAHANHVPLEGANADDSSDHQKERRFNLDDQIRLKIAFCQHQLSADADGRFYLIGHSIGAYIALRMLPWLLDSGWNVISCFCLFPTVENMAATPNGKWVGPMVKVVDQFDWYFHWLFTLLNFVPKPVKRWLTAQRLDNGKTPECVLEAVVELANPLVARNIAHMANHELHAVLEFDDSLLARKERLIFFYGRSDKWAPLEFGERMRQRMAAESGRVLIDSTVEGFEHAFVLNHSREMAELLVEITLEAA